MPFDPTLPQENTEIDAVQMRGQLTSLNDDIQTRTTQGDVSSAVTTALNQTSNTTNGVGTLGQNADGGYNATQMQDVINKLDELILTLRR